MLNVPLVILLDIDGTLIGDISPQVIMYELKKRLKLPYNAKNLHEQLNSGIIRPHFKSFFNDLKDYGVEFFIYTASEKKWAEHIVKQIEATSGVKFNRPLFTRNNCQLVNGEYKKSIAHVLPSVVKCLKKKYNNLTVASLRNMVMAIDNNNVYSSVDRKNLVLCDTYPYSSPENIPLYINRSLFDKHSSVIMNLLSSYYPSIKYTTSYMKFEKQYYIYYVQMLDKTLKLKSVTSLDTLFKTIRNFIINKNISTFNENVVQYLNTKLHSQKNETRTFF
jgi:hydroxymethylpyrimidine pyrophosphatase-like HAD family hydrolase